MTQPQILAFSLVSIMMIAFIWGRYRYDLVAVAALLGGLALGIVPLDQAFSGFSNDIVIIVGSALLVSAAVARSGLMEAAVQRAVPNLKAVHGQVFVLVSIVTVLSAFVKNIGALSIMIPIAFQFARRSQVSPSVFLMPMAFGSLLGGLMTQIGTSPNVIVSEVRAQLGGEPFTMFDFTPVGAVLALVGILFLTFFYWLLPERQREGGGIEEAIDIKNYLSEAHVTEASPLLGKTVAELMSVAEGEAVLSSILRANAHRAPLPDAVLRDGDILLMEGKAEALDKVVAHGRLELSNGRSLESGNASEIGTIEAVIMANSLLDGLSARALALSDTFQVNLLAVSRHGVRLKQRVGQITLRTGDVVLIQGDRSKLPDTLREFGCLPLAERPIMLGSVRRGLIPVGILAVAMGAVAAGLVPVAVSFFAAAAAMVLFKAIPLREVYASIDGPILVMLAALIPVSESLRETGATDLIADALVSTSQILPAYGALALILLVAMAVTPFLNNAATVLIMAPIAASFATGLGFRPEAFLMAVAIGAGCDFLTPIGHQCNTLVMGPGGYRFSDYPRLGLPLSILVVLVSVPTLMIVWPL
ncbi:SLC13 family permease [Limoniibacter endophyticus]|uniref:Permease n=1 Tax=Limoniibacter endophyticus TaxID=1565040 RepID=A0A8J3DMW4_9HYPH|nr:SLC13 family permease [Limoniibacter endophyticus]GHC68882.1 permease [Limoniibacter endophyticus]